MNLRDIFLTQFQHCALEFSNCWCTGRPLSSRSVAMFDLDGFLKDYTIYLSFLSADLLLLYSIRSDSLPMHHWHLLLQVNRGLLAETL